MTITALQYSNKTFFPASRSDEEKIKHFQENQIIKANLTVPRDQQIIRQLRLYWMLCRIVADNDESWDTPEKVDLHVKAGLRFFDIDNAIIRNGYAIFNPYSVSVSNLKRIKEYNFFERAAEMMAAKLNVTVSELIKMGSSNA